MTGYGPNASTYTVAGYPEFDGSQVCAQADPEEWFPVKGESPARARELCRGCEWVRPCLAYALTHAVDGVWGATTELQRRELRRVHGLTIVRPIIPAALPVATDREDPPA